MVCCQCVLLTHANIQFLQLGFAYGTIKACVLIENILASFEAEEILYELRDHSIGLNCGIWDYCASFINKFGEWLSRHNNNNSHRFLELSSQFDMF